ncbi:MAG: OadG family protein [Lachnospiraceae bacterium]|nr:OadG family protein [Lachnospiraceae bacterium]
MSKKLRLLFSLASLMIIMSFSCVSVYSDEVNNDNQEVSAEEAPAENQEGAADGDQINAGDFGNYMEEPTTTVDDTIMYLDGKISLAQLKQAIAQYKAYIPQMGSLGDDELEYLVKNSGDQTGFFENYMTTVVGGKLGNFVAEEDEVKVEELKEEGSENELKITTKMHFTNDDADFIVTVKVFDNLGPIVQTASFKTIEDEGLSTKMKSAFANMLMGMGTVFIVLIVMMLIISCFAFIPKIQAAFAGKKKDDKEVANNSSTPVAEPGNTNRADDGELVAVIAAAIAASEGTSTDGFIVRSIRRR